MSSPPEGVSSGTEMSAFRPLPSRLPPVPSLTWPPCGKTSVSCSLRCSLDQLARDADVRLRAYGGHVIKDDRLSKAGCFGEPDISRNDGIEDLRTEVLARLGGDLPREVQS